jgi:group I intron endonuclease
MIGIYKITSPSKRTYIGQSIDIENRWIKYKNINNSKVQQKLYRSFIKYGIDNHIFEILEECPTDELDNTEIKWINHFKTNKTGLNILEGGGNSRKGVKHTNETKQKMSDSHLGKQDTEQTKNKKSQSAKGKIKNETHRTNLSKSCSEAFGRPVIQKSLNGEFIKEWNTGKQASVELNLSYTSINNCCRRKEINPTKYTYSQGFIFEYKFPN